MSFDDPEPKLQPVHRIFLGEIFAFIFFFAGAMSVLVGPLGQPLVFSAVMVISSAVMSAITFFWIAFITPTKSDEPRYGFLMLSLLPTLVMCPVFIILAGYLSQSMNLQQRPPVKKTSAVIFSRRDVPAPAALSPSAAYQ